MPENPESAAPGEGGSAATRSPATRSLMLAIILDTWPNEAACNQFGIRSQEHYEAIYYPVRHGEITADQLENAGGNGPMLTQLVNAASRNPHKDILFDTAVANTANPPFEKQVAEAARRATPRTGEKENGMDMEQ
jgi:hypothetical protein